jgi:lipoic acid synthetase
MSTVPLDPFRKQRGAEKLAKIPVKIIPNSNVLPKPDWIRVKASFSPELVKVKEVLREHRLVTVCEEASCPNLSECFSKGTATFMIMGDKCTRRCSFCDVAHGRPDPLDLDEPMRLAKAIAAMGLRYVVITSVDRDDLKDGGAGHFAACIKAARIESPSLQIETLVPDFRGRMEIALDNLALALPDVLNHNLETVPRLYRQARPGSDFQWSLNLIKNFKQRFPQVPTKSGLMLGLGETDEEIMEVLKELRAHNCDRLTLGQYLQPSPHHIPVKRYVSPAQFAWFSEEAYKLGFDHVASGPLVRSSYHADKQAAGEEVI